MLQELLSQSSCFCHPFVRISPSNFAAQKQPFQAYTKNEFNVTGIACNLKQASGLEVLALMPSLVDRRCWIKHIGLLQEFIYEKRRYDSQSVPVLLLFGLLRQSLLSFTCIETAADDLYKPFFVLKSAITKLSST
jgi:hypothetical protein